MRIILIAIFLKIGVLTVIGQTLTTSDKVLKVGIYKKFEQIKANNPPFKFNYEVQLKKSKWNNYDYYKVNISRKEGRSIGTVYAFFDGDNVYVSIKFSNLGPNKLFTKVEVFDTFWYYQKVTMEQSYGGVNKDQGSPMNGSPTTNVSAELTGYFLNLKNGERITLSQQTLEDHIRDDKQLLNEFKSLPETQKYSKLKEYFLKYESRTN